MTNIAILGCGSIAYAMAKTLRMMRDQGEEVRLYAAASRDKAKAEAFCKSEGFEVAYGSYETRVHAKIGQCKHGISGRTARSPLYIQCGKAFLYALLLLVTDKRHTPLG